jgi:hypothetical protein
VPPLRPIDQSTRVKKPESARTAKKNKRQSRAKNLQQGLERTAAPRVRRVADTASETPCQDADAARPGPPTSPAKTTNLQLVNQSYSLSREVLQETGEADLQQAGVEIIGSREQRRHQDYGLLRISSKIAMSATMKLTRKPLETLSEGTIVYLWKMSLPNDKQAKLGKNEIVATRAGLALCKPRPVLITKIIRQGKRMKLQGYEIGTHRSNGTECITDKEWLAQQFWIKLTEWSHDLKMKSNSFTLFIRSLEKAEVWHKKSYLDLTSPISFDPVEISRVAAYIDNDNFANFLLVKSQITTTQDMVTASTSQMNRPEVYCDELMNDISEQDGSEVEQASEDEDDEADMITTTATPTLHVDAEPASAYGPSAYQPVARNG